MNIIKKYFFEIFFLVSFCLPFIKITNIENGVTIVKYITGLELFITYFYIIVPSIACYILCLKYKIAVLKYCTIILYICFILISTTLGDIVSVPPKEYFIFFTDILPKISVWGLYINLIAGFLVISKLFSSKLKH